MAHDVYGKSSGDGHSLERVAAPGKFFALVHHINTMDNSENYTSIAQTYTRHSVVWSLLTVKPGQFIKFGANGQVDQKGLTTMEIVQKIEIYDTVTQSFYEGTEETGVNINGRTSAATSEHRDRHHEDFATSGSFDTSILGLTEPRDIYVMWNFRARESTTSAVVPIDSARLTIDVYEEIDIIGLIDDRIALAQT
jgi:hypothetical protein